MNTSRLLEIIATLREIEEQYQIQSRIQNVLNALNNLTSNPQDQNFQAELPRHLDTLGEALAGVHNRIQPAQAPLLEEIGAYRFFGADIAGEIATVIRDNPATLAVARQQVERLTGERQSFLARIANVEEGLRGLNVRVNQLEPGNAEIGFQLPRKLFDNDFDGLIKELRDIRFIIRAVSEVVIGAAEPVEVRQISTSDPLFFFGINAAIIVALGGVVTWALDTWERVEKIRKIRREAQEIRAISDAEIEKFLTSKIKAEIDASVSEKIEEMLSQRIHEAGRTHELKSHLNVALQSVLAHVERGMTVEIRLSPPKPADPDEIGRAAEEQELFQSLNTLRRQLRFPAVQDTPILQLPQTPANGSPSTSESERKPIKAKNTASGRGQQTKRIIDI